MAHLISIYMSKEVPVGADQPAYPPSLISTYSCVLPTKIDSMIPEVSISKIQDYPKFSNR